MNKTKVAILTQSPCGNYGGMLQACALQLVLRKMGCRSEILSLWHHETWQEKMRRVAHQLKTWFYQLFCKADERKSYDSSRQQMTIDFVSRFLKVANAGLSGARVLFSLDAYDRYVVGSDQIWRAAYLRYFCPVDYFFLSFLPEEIRRKSFSYSASFGSDEWEGTLEESLHCSELLKQFKAVSVREFSGLTICKEVFGVDAVQMPDPTLLVGLEDYELVINSEKTRVPKAPYFASYVLDDSDETSRLVDRVEKDTGLYHQRLLPKSSARKRCDRFYCTVAQWLRYLRDCESVVTDSFHGCVFSIIYNKPFVCLGNEGRGMARFDSLFKTFGLEDRLVLSRDRKEVLRVLDTPIDWDRVNAIHESERQRGLDFLKNNLYDVAPPEPHV